VSHYNAEINGNKKPARRPAAHPFRIVHCPDQSARRDALSIKDVRAISDSCTRVSKAEWSVSDTLSLRMTKRTKGSSSKAANVRVQTVDAHIACHHSR
jgi:hypothetical protein